MRPADARGSSYTICHIQYDLGKWRRLHGHGGRCPTFTNDWTREGTVSRKTANKKTDQTVLTITKALTKATNCALRARKLEGHD